MPYILQIVPDLLLLFSYNNQYVLYFLYVYVYIMMYEGIGVKSSFPLRTVC
jgi:hypothetical protein